LGREDAPALALANDMAPAKREEPEADAAGERGADRTALRPPATCGGRRSQRPAPPPPRGPPPSRQAPPRSPPPPAQGVTMTAPRRPAAAAPPAGTGPGGSNRCRPGPRPRPFRGLARHSRANARSWRGRGGASSKLRLPALPLSNWRRGGPCGASDYNSRHAMLCAAGTAWCHGVCPPRVSDYESVFCA
jgi:hypothetical protein